MWVPRDDLPPLRHVLRQILEGQGPDACKQVLESKTMGAEPREHAENCAGCADVVRELYGDKEIPVTDNYLTPELLEFLREIDE